MAEPARRRGTMSRSRTVWVVVVGATAALLATSCVPEEVPGGTGEPDPADSYELDQPIDCADWRYGDPDPVDLPAEYDPDNGYKFHSKRSTERTLFNSPQQHCGQRGAAIDLAWSVTDGRDDVVIAVLDSGIEWRNVEAMQDLAHKAHLNRGELTPPQPADPSGRRWDRNGDGSFNILDYESDPRVADENANGLLDPEDLILDPDFNNGRDDDRNGYVDDISGWDFLFDDNNPLDEVDYGHGTGEAKDSTAAANGTGDVGACPQCRFLPVRVGDSFITDGARFAAGVLFGLDSGADLIQEALGVLNDPPQAQQAIDAAYDRGVPVVASMADEASKHANLPGALERTLSLNSITETESPPWIQPHGFMELNGCTNYGGHTHVSVPSDGCSSEATGIGAGIVGLLESAARDAVDVGTIDPYPGQIGDGVNVLSANETYQLVQGTADDIDFATPTVGDPANNVAMPGLVNLLWKQTRYPTTAGWDATTGYGRINAFELVKNVEVGEIPPEAEISSPRWFSLEPTAGDMVVEGRVAALRTDSFGYRVEWTVGLQAPPYPGADVWHTATEVTGLEGERSGELAVIDRADIAAALPDGGAGSPVTSDGLPDEERFTVRVRVVVTDDAGRTGRDQKQVFVHDDPDLVDGFPAWTAGVGASNPVFADIDGEDGDELLIAGDDGVLHAYTHGGGEARGFPVEAIRAPFWHDRSPTARADGIPRARNAFFVGAPVVADLDDNGDVEIAATDNDGNLYVWEHNGRRRHGFGNTRVDGDLRTRTHTENRFSEESIRDPNNRMKRGVTAPPVAVDLNGDGRLELAVAAMDRHLYAFTDRGRPVDGFPVLLVDPEKVDAVDPDSHSVTFSASSKVRQGGELIAPPAAGDVDGDGLPELVVGAQEQYAETPHVLPPLGIGEDSGNSRLYVVEPEGTNASGPEVSGAHPAEQAYHDGWPVKMPMLLIELLPTIGDGVSTQAALGDVNADGALDIVASSATGQVMVLDESGAGIYGNLFGLPAALGWWYPDRGSNSNNTDFPFISSIGGPTLGNLSGGDHPNIAAPQSGVGRAIDTLLPGFQQGSPMVQVWDGVKPRATRELTGFPRVTTDVGLFVSPGIVDLDGDGRPEVVAGNGEYMLDAWNKDGETPGGWPKLTGGWVVGTPGAGDWDGDGDVEIAVGRRDGMLLVWETDSGTDALGEWPRYGHDGRNSGNYGG